MSFAPRIQEWATYSCVHETNRLVGAARATEQRSAFHHQMGEGPHYPSGYRHQPTPHCTDGRFQEAAGRIKPAFLSSVASIKTTKRTAFSVMGGMDQLQFVGAIEAVWSRNLTIAFPWW